VQCGTVVVPVVAEMCVDLSLASALWPPIVKLVYVHVCLLSRRCC
jgi:hypothetical protein